MYKKQTLHFISIVKSQWFEHIVAALYTYAEDILVYNWKTVSEIDQGMDLTRSSNPAYAYEECPSNATRKSNDNKCLLNVMFSCSEM